MSTKIYNGYKIKASSLDEAIKSINSIKEKAKLLYVKQEINELIKQSVEQIDLYFIDKENIKNKAMNKNFSTNDESNKKGIESAISTGKKENSSQNKDSDWEIILYPDKLSDSQSDYYIFQIYGGDALEKLIKNLLKNKVDEYGYWNNSDKEDKIGELEWKKRQKDWDHCLTGKNKTGVPSMEGISIKFVNAQNGLFLKDKERDKLLMTCCKSWTNEKRYEQRVVKFTNIMMSDILYDDNLEKKSNSPSFSAYMNIFMKVQSQDFTQEQQQKYELIKQLMNKSLLKEITIESLRAPLYDVWHQESLKILNEKLSENLPIVAIENKNKI